MDALKIVFKGILQSWGTDDCSWSNLRKTELYPTKSAVTGIFACALGYKKGSKEIQELHDSYTLYLDINKAETGNILEDLQSIGTRIKNDDGTRGDIYTANKTKKRPPIVRKQYLNGAYFELYVVGDKCLLDKLASALDRPYWPYYLGRKCCTPSKRVNGGVCEIEIGENLLCIG